MCARACCVKNTLPGVNCHIVRGALGCRRGGETPGSAGPNTEWKRPKVVKGAKPSRSRARARAGGCPRGKKINPRTCPCLFVEQLKGCCWKTANTTARLVSRLVNTGDVPRQENGRATEYPMGPLTTLRR